MNIPFFSPIHPGVSSTNENLSFLRPATTIFDFGQKSYRIQDVSGHLVEIDTPSPAWYAVALSVAAIMTVVIPLLAIAMIALYRYANRFQVVQPLLFSNLPEDVQKLVCKNMVFHGNALAETNKQINGFMNNDRDLVKNRIFASAIEESLKVANDMKGNSQAAEALCDIAKLVLKLDVKKGVEIVVAALEKAKLLVLYDDLKGQAMAKIAKVLAPYDLEQAQKIVQVIPEGYETLARANIAKAIAKTDYKSAQEIVKSINDAHHRPLVLAKIAIGMAKDDLPGALEIIESLKEGGIKALISILPLIESVDKEKALLMANKIIISAYLGSFGSRNYSNLIDLLCRHDKERALQFVDFMREYETFARFDVDAAIEQTERILTEDGKVEAFCAMAKGIAKTNPEKGYELAKRALEIAERQQKGRGRCAEAIALFNLEEAFEIVESLGELNRTTPLTNFLKMEMPAEKISKVYRLLFKVGKGIGLVDPGLGERRHSLGHDVCFKLFINAAKAALGLTLRGV